MKKENNQLMEELLEFIEDGNVDAVKALVSKNKLNVKAMNLVHSCPLIHICPLIQDGDVAIQMLKCLLSYGLDVFETKDDITILEVAVEFGSLAIVELLISKYKFRINFTNMNQQNLLHLAVKANEIKLIQYFIKNGVDINGGDITKMTPLHYAVISMSLPVVKILILQGADANIKNLNDISPLDFAFKLNLTTIISQLKNEHQTQKLKYVLVFNNKQLKKKDLHKKQSIQKQLQQSMKNIKNIPISWQQKQLKLLNEFLNHQYGYIFYDQVKALQDKLRRNKFKNMGVYFKQLQQILDQFEETFKREKQILDVILQMKAKI